VPLSLIASLRSASPFISSRDSGESIFRPQTRQASGSIAVTPRPTHWTDEPRPLPPALDRTVDLFVDTGILTDPGLVFEQLIQKNHQTCEDHPIFAFPDEVRRNIYSYCFPKEIRKINLSPRFATKEVWPKNYFASPWEVLEEVTGGLSSSRALRNELMTYFWTQYHFHVTLTPFSGPKFSPLSHIWLNNYLGIIQNLTVEADLTRFGGCQLKDAPQFGYDVIKMESLLVAIVNGILNRQDEATIAEFNIMCRRYTGYRPNDEFDAIESSSGGSEGAYLFAQLHRAFDLHTNRTLDYSSILP
jgi:hypothetical protein